MKTKILPDFKIFVSVPLIITSILLTELNALEFFVGIFLPHRNGFSKIEKPKNDSYSA